MTATTATPLAVLTMTCVGSLAVGVVGDSDQSSFVLLLGMLLATYSVAAHATPRKAVLGSEVTEHESGIHTAAMLHDPSVFEPFDPERFGGERRLLFGTGTGASGASTLLSRVDVKPTDARTEEFLSLLAEVGPVGETEALELASSID